MTKRPVIDRNRNRSNFTYRQVISWSRDRIGKDPFGGAIKVALAIDNLVLRLYRYTQVYVYRYI